MTPSNYLYWTSIICCLRAGLSPHIHCSYTSFSLWVCVIGHIRLVGESPYSAPIESQKVQPKHRDYNRGEGEIHGWEEKKKKNLIFQQIFFSFFFGRKTFLSLSAPFWNIMARLSRPRTPFKSLSRRRRWKTSSTRLWLMFKEKIMEIQCRDQKRVLLPGTVIK